MWKARCCGIRKPLQRGGREPALGIVFSHRGPAFLTLKDWLNIIERFPFVVGASRRHPRVSSKCSVRAPSCGEEQRRTHGPGSGRGLRMIDRRLFFGADWDVEEVDCWSLIIWKRRLKVTRVQRPLLHSLKGLLVLPLWLKWQTVHKVQMSFISH